MKVIKTKNYEQMSDEASTIIVNKIMMESPIVLGLATGSTPIGVYDNLTKNVFLDWSKVTTFNLDEYVGLAPNDPQSYNFFMNKHLFSKTINPIKSYNLPLGNAKDLKKECKNYDERIKEAGGIDLQLLGIGTDGHIGFCEPSNKFSIGTRVVKLAQQTLTDNAEKYFNGNEELIPKYAISMGCVQITKARQIIILAFGENKAKAVAAAIEGPFTPRIPASILQKYPDKVTWIIDEAAAKYLKNNNSI